MKNSVSPAEIELRKRDAALVCDIFRKWEELPSHPKREETYMRAKEWFEKKHACGWQYYAQPDKGSGRGA